MEPVTGLLAEFRRDLEQMLQERYAGQVRVQTVRDEVLRREIEMRQLFLFTVGEGAAGRPGGWAARGEATSSEVLRAAIPRRR